jgi:hypothetical protein
MNSHSGGVGELQDNVGQACGARSNQRTFPGPWSVDQIPQGYRVLDANHHVLAYVVTSDEGTKDQCGGLTLEEARRIARVISSLPDLITEFPMGRTKRSWWNSPVNLSFLGRMRHAIKSAQRSIGCARDAGKHQFDMVTRVVG